MTDYSKITIADLVQLLICGDYLSESEHAAARAEVVNRLEDHRAWMLERCVDCVCARREAKP